MATYHGKTGMMVVDTGTDGFEIENWSFSTTADIVDVTAMGDTWEKYNNGGATDFTGRCEGKVESGEDYSLIIGTGVDIQFELQDSTAYFSGTAIVTQIEEEWSIDDVGKLRYEFIGNDAAGLAYT